MSEKIIFSFNKQSQTIAKSTCEYLCAKLDPEDDAEIIRNLETLTSGQVKKLKSEAANSLLKKLLCAIIINDDLNESLAPEETATTENETENESDTEHESDSGEDADSENENENDPNNTIKPAPKKVLEKTILTKVNTGEYKVNTGKKVPLKEEKKKS